MADFSDTFINNTIRLCASCCQEQGIDTAAKKHVESLGWMITDSLCIRHFKRTFKLAGFSDEKIDKMVKDSQEKSKNPPIRDLSENENKILVDWLKEPKPYQKRP